MRKLATLIRMYGECGELRAIRATKVRNDVGVRREPAAFHLEVIAAKDPILGNDDLRLDGLCLRARDGKRQAHE